jgi:hypothetical protein
VGLYKALGGGWTQATVAQPAAPATTVGTLNTGSR